MLPATFDQQLAWLHGEVLLSKLLEERQHMLLSLAESVKMAKKAAADNHDKEETARLRRTFP